MKGIKYVFFGLFIFLTSCSNPDGPLSTVDFVEYSYVDSMAYRNMSNNTQALNRSYYVNEIAQFDVIDECRNASLACTSKQSFRFRVPSEPGLYWAVADEYAFPINVLDLDSQKACLLVNSFTAQAYNKKGGHSFYSTPYDKILSVSLLRPITSGSLKKSVGAHTHNFPVYDLAKQLDIELHVFDDLFLHQNANFLESSCSYLIFSEHPEYWTDGMYEQIKQYVRNGGDILNMSANIAYWRVLFDQNDASIAVDKRSEGVKKNRFKFFEPDATTLFGGYYLGYPVTRYANDQLIFEERYPVLAQLPELEYQKLRKMKIVDQSHSLFKCLVDSGGFLSDEPLKVELDGVTLGAYKAGDISWRPQAQLSEVNGALITAWAVYGKSIIKLVVARDYINQYGGRVMQFGSIGWADVAMKNHDFGQITKLALSSFSNLAYDCQDAPIAEAE